MFDTAARLTTSLLSGHQTSQERIERKGCDVATSPLLFRDTEEAWQQTSFLVDNVSKSQDQQSNQDCSKCQQLQEVLDDRDQKLHKLRDFFASQYERLDKNGEPI